MSKFLRVAVCWVGTFVFLVFFGLGLFAYAGPVPYVAWRWFVKLAGVGP
jgi:hypothetical protein